MFGVTWSLDWEPKQTTLGDVTCTSSLLDWAKKYGVITATSADWFYPVKRESKEALKQLVEHGVLWKGILRSNQKKITIYACDPRPSVDECVRRISEEKILDVLLDRVPEVRWQSGAIKIGDKVWKLRVVYQNDPVPENSENVLWIGDDWDRIKRVAQPGHLATSLDLFQKGLVMRLQGGSWVPDHNFQWA